MKIIGIIIILCTVNIAHAKKVDSEDKKSRIVQPLINFKNLPEDQDQPLSLPLKKYLKTTPTSAFKEVNPLKIEIHIKTPSKKETLKLLALSSVLNLLQRKNEPKPEVVSSLDFETKGYIGKALKTLKKFRELASKLSNNDIQYCVEENQPYVIFGTPTQPTIMEQKIKDIEKSINKRLHKKDTEVKELKEFYKKNLEKTSTKVKRGFYELIGQKTDHNLIKLLSNFYQASAAKNVLKRSFGRHSDKTKPFLYPKEAFDNIVKLESNFLETLKSLKLETL